MPHRLLSLDGWRALAILAVLLSHATMRPTLAPAAVGDFLTGTPFRGDVGVNVFFCISGFLITTLLMREEADSGRVRWLRFLGRRALRLLPVYFAYVLAVVGLWSMRQQPWDFWQLAPSLTFTVEIWSPGAWSWPLAHFWSLSVEQQFYLVWPLLFIVVPPDRRVPFVAALTLTLPLLRGGLYLTHQLQPLALPMLRSADFLLMGGLAALLQRPLGGWLKKHPRAAAGSLVFALGLWTVNHHATSFGVPVPVRFAFERVVAIPLMAAGFTLAIAATALAPSGLLVRVLNSRPLVWLGTISYSTYVWQQLLLDPTLPSPKWWQRFPANLFLAVAAGAASYYLWERWFLRLKRPLASRQPSTRAAAPVAV